MNIPYTTEQQVSTFILENRDKYSIAELTKILGFKSKTSIINRIKKLKIPRKNPRKGDALNLLSDDLNAYYWAGFLLADGHFTKTNQLVLVSSTKDKDHLEKFANFIKTTVKTYNRSVSSTNYQGSETQFCRVTIQDKDICRKFVEKFDINPQKTYNPPDFRKWNFTEDQLKSLIIGFIDGDGSFPSPHTIKIECHSSWREILNFFKQSCESFFDEKILPISDENRKYCYIYFRKAPTEKLREFAISNKLPFLARKWFKDFS